MTLAPPTLPQRLRAWAAAGATVALDAETALEVAQLTEDLESKLEEIQTRTEELQMKTAQWTGRRDRALATRLLILAAILNLLTIAMIFLTSIGVIPQ